ncbi:MAG: hypothetical protein BM557_11595 [Flavobacterium sp. MedPE-SWcel]|uniref:T9SS-dependent choice-of-anchor J family protein n=1 Tax=uncultured Flavobacterium sp. TaxID=165435 RepID=UPI000922140B|nr:T9SS type A sorting domain-containing protein [uncultured Flavobacterium sp.]OIQ15352.1 MAG: hypothetical protein BM557_11595 [Flavobacterium sp. MedPE-SWcel]
MKKHLLLGAFLFGSLLTANAQADCANAVAITTNGTTTSAAITGAYGGTCWGGTQNQQNPAGALMANWYSYTPAANGLLTISSVLAANPVASTDTRLSIFTGTCAALECYNGSDDVDAANNDYRTTMTVPVESGVTYYIAWDNNWASTGFDFSVDFAANDCLSTNSLGVNDFTDFTVSSASLTWDAAIGAPANYDVKVGDLGFDPTAAGMDFSTDTNSVDLTGLSTTDNAALQVYLRSNCGATQGDWVGPYNLYLAANSPYSNGFDEAATGLAGFTVDTGWGRTTDAAQQAALAHEGGAFLFSNSSTTAVSDSWLFSRALDLTAGQEVTLTFQTRYLGAATDTFTLDVTVGTGATSADQGAALETLTIPAAATYAMQTVTYTPATSGVYFFGFHNTTAVTTAATTLLLDTVNVTGGTATVNGVDSSKFAVYPNPATNVINIANADNALVNGVELVDLNGRTVKSMKFDGAVEAQINISDLANGMYIMNISSDRGTVTKKIVKN